MSYDLVGVSLGFPGLVNATLVEMDGGLSSAHLWRGSSLPLGREAAPAILQQDWIVRFCDCFAAEREQAPSPQSCPGF
ncbi:hypothetical protein EMIT0P100_190108 [Pseudomonas sp. IT-P100]